MVKPASKIRTILLVGVGVATLTSAGCGFVPEGRLGECHKMSRALQAENARLKDKYLTTKAQNDELTLRSLDDERQLRAKDEVIASMSQSVAEYQKDREQTEKAVERMKSALQSLNGGVRVSATSSSATLTERARSLAQRRPGAEFDPTSMTLDVPADALFEPKRNELKPDAEAWLEEVAGLLGNPSENKAGPRIVSIAGEPNPVRRTSVEDRDRADADALGLSRARRIRDVLASKSGLDRAKISVAGEGPDVRSQDRSGPRIAIELGASAPESEAKGPAAASAPTGP